MPVALTAKPVDKSPYYELTLRFKLDEVVNRISPENCVTRKFGNHAYMGSQRVNRCSLSRGLQPL